MFLSLPFHVSNNLQHIVLVLNTVLIITILIFAELVYSETPKDNRKHLRQFYPLIVVFVGILIYAGFKQIGSS